MGCCLLTCVDSSSRRICSKISSASSNKTGATRSRFRLSRPFPFSFRISRTARRSVADRCRSDFLVFILSNNHINDLITTPLDFMDEDVVSQYISFLKLLSMNLTSDTVQFFYNYVIFSPLCDCRPSLRIPSLFSPSAASSMTIPNPWSVLQCERSR